MWPLHGRPAIHRLGRDVQIESSGLADQGAGDFAATGDFTIRLVGASAHAHAQAHGREDGIPRTSGTPNSENRWFVKSPVAAK
eukprot:CAMPEP_0195011222 /NCGR_PEP_ID=MMETSP0326_2-20130528/10770_1 /TAXON_ID=2866 ORGANISM="Crypthecodinium cohnii, Strain Seligo" /NCGR_SAMPLE_ID=MMETSP0326_2 /ASSEMBLY_ACC=CAM_ASM_000348 /LENGTH=82 /DNA_ID=CAMNT_0040020239 /DNA_START=115 /DNA_END=360 /DNA_ORIENTATION=-